MNLEMDNILVVSASKAYCQNQDNQPPPGQLLLYDLTLIV